MSEPSWDQRGQRSATGTPPPVSVAGPRPDVFNPECGTRAVLDLLADKWTVLVVGALNEGVCRHGALRRRVAGITTKMLTQTLRRLESDGLVARTVHPGLPLRVDYRLTELGQTLVVPLSALCAWAAEHLEEVEGHRALWARSQRARS